jgi:hypothetical protein
MYFMKTAYKILYPRQMFELQSNKLFAKRELGTTNHFHESSRSYVSEHSVSFPFIPPLHNFTVNQSNHLIFSIFIKTSLCLATN